MNKLDSSTIQAYEQARLALDQYNDLVLKRVSYIVTKINEALQYPIKRVDLHTSNGGVFLFGEDPFVYYYGECSPRFDFSKVDPDTANDPNWRSLRVVRIDGELIDIKSYFPRRWLSEDFEDELTAAVKDSLQE